MTSRRASAAVLAVVGVEAVVLVLAVGLLTVGADAFRAVLGQDQTRFEAAMAGAPAASRYSWTDWAGVRDELGSDVDADSSRAAVERFLDDGFEADLTSTSALVSSATDLQRRWGFSPASLEWELFSQSEAGALVQLGVPDDYDFAALADRLEDLGYERPDDDLSGGLWDGGTDLVAGIANVTPEVAFIALDEEAGTITTSDQQGSISPGLGSLGDDLVAESDAPVDDVDDEGLADVVDALVAGDGDPVTAAVYSGDFACATLAMSQADQAARSQADQLLAAAGSVNPLAGFGIGLYPGGDARVELSFETEEQARTNADTRARLAAGPAPGQGGDFSERFTLGDVTADGRAVTLRLDPEPGSYPISDLSNGPVLFATC